MTSRRIAAAALLVGLLVACSGGSSSTSARRGAGSDAGFSDGAKGPEQGDHVHVAYAVAVCGEEQPPLQDAAADELGIHTHGDGLIHVHPFASSAAGRKATMNVFLDDVGAKATDSTLTLPDGSYTVGKDDCGGEPAVLEAAVWDDAQDADDGKAPDLVATGADINDIVLKGGRAITIAFHAAGADIPGPTDAAQRLADIGDVATSSSAGSEPTAQVTIPTAGATITGDTPCPAADGSSPRTTTFAKAPPMCIDPTTAYRAAIATSEGTFTVALNAAAAPQTVNSFVVLARYHYYDGVAFHRIIPGFVVQGGDATGPTPGVGGPGYEYADELPTKGPPYYSIGSVAMANAGPNTNGSQFFIVTGASGASLPGAYSLFGQVASGGDVVKAIEAYGTSSGAVTKVVTITGVTITP